MASKDQGELLLLSKTSIQVPTENIASFSSKYGLQCNQSVTSNWADLQAFAQSCMVALTNNNAIHSNSLITSEEEIVFQTSNTVNPTPNLSNSMNPIPRKVACETRKQLVNPSFNTNNTINPNHQMTSRDEVACQTSIYANPNYYVAPNNNINPNINYSTNPNCSTSSTKVAFDRANNIANPKRMAYSRSHSKNPNRVSSSTYYSYGVNLQNHGCNKPQKIMSNNAAAEVLRRRHMTQLFYSLRKLLPSDTVPQNHRCNLIDEACNHIKALEKKLDVLKKKEKVLRGMPSVDYKLKHNKMEHTNGEIEEEITIDDNKMKYLEEPLVNLMLNPKGNMVNLCIACSEKTMSRLSNILHFLDKLDLEVLNANFSLNNNNSLYVINCKVRGANSPFSTKNLMRLKSEITTLVKQAKKIS